MPTPGSVAKVAAVQSYSQYASNGASLGNEGRSSTYTYTRPSRGSDSGSGSYSLGNSQR